MKTVILIDSMDLPNGYYDEVLGQWPGGFSNNTAFPLDWLDLTLCPKIKEYMDTIENSIGLEIYINWNW